MSKNNHLLQKVIFEIGTPQQEGAFEIQSRISNAFTSTILKRLEVLLDAHISPNQFITIEKLEFDLGRINNNQLEETISDALEKEFEHLLAAIEEEITQHGQLNSENYKFTLRLPQNGKAEFQAKINVRNENSSRFERMRLQLEFGIVPNTTERVEKITLQQSIAEILKEHPDQFIVYLIGKRFEENVLARLVLNLDEVQLQRIAQLLHYPLHSNLPELIRKMIEFCEATSIEKKDLITSSLVSSFGFDKIVWFVLLKEFLQHANLSTTANQDAPLQEAPVSLLSIFNSPRSIAKLKIIPAKTWDRIEKNATGEWKTALKAIRKSTSNSAEEKTNKRKVQNSGTSSPEQSMKVESLNKDSATFTEQHENKLADTPTSSAENKELDKILEEGVYVNNAGLIIIAPYLSPLFSHLELLNKNEFISVEAAWKAVHLLQYATGMVPSEENGTWSEHDLLFNKILCGLEPNAPVPESFSLTNKDKEEIDELLKAVLQNWTIMSRSSAHALQTTFFQKKGKLNKIGPNWDLLVERDSAVEILIDKLPWGISLIKLPWNIYTIHTQW